MLRYPKTVKEAKAHRYHKWAGNPKGCGYNEKRCAYEVFGDFCVSYQCSRKNGHGPDKLYCKQHAKMVSEK